MPNSLEELLAQAYSETHELLKRPELCKLVKRGLLISYGPPIQEPDLLLLSFQGAGKTSSKKWTTWPPKFLYLRSKYEFGKALRNLCGKAGLSESLATSAMALPVVFPQSPSSRGWMNKTGPHSVWRHHSVKWVKRLTDEIRPKVVMVFGAKTSRALGIDWEDAEYAPGRRGQIFGLSKFRGAPAVYCHHLSQGWEETEALKCFRYAKKKLVSRQ